MELKKRLRSWAVWLAVLGQLGVILQALGAFDRLGVSSEAFTTVVTAVGAILTTFGILNNPTERDKF